MTLPILLTLAGYFIFSAAVGAMYPPSEAQKPGFYGWLYRTLQALAANAARVAEARFGALGVIPGLSANTEAAASSTTSSTTSIVQQRFVEQQQTGTSATSGNK